MIVRLALMRSGYSLSESRHADFDTETRTLTEDNGNVTVWEGDDLPWLPLDPVTVLWVDGSSARTSDRPPLWAKVNDDGSDPPGYGDTPGEDEAFVDGLMDFFNTYIGGADVGE